MAIAAAIAPPGTAPLYFRSERLPEEEAVTNPAAVEGPSWTHYSHTGYIVNGYSGGNRSARYSAAVLRMLEAISTSDIPAIPTTPPASNRGKRYPNRLPIGWYSSAMLPATNSTRSSVGLNFQYESWNVPSA